MDMEPTSTPFQKIRARYAESFSDKRFVKSFVWGFGLILISLVINYFASLYAAERASSSVSDIILSNIPVFDVDGLFIWGPLVFWGIMIVIAFRNPKQVPFIAKNIAIFVAIRAVFITLTHIGPYPDQIPMNVFGENWIQHLTDNANFFIFSSGSDLFFSAHTGLPFLMALIYWKNRYVRLFCIAASAFFGVVVLIGHLHYSIDVASAFFISYTIFIIATKAFPKDWQRLLTAF